MEGSKNILTIPMAIVLAGGLVAGAIFLRGNSNLAPAVAAEKQVGALQPPPPLSLGAITVKPIDPARDHIRGNPDADVVFIEFSDPECPFCKRFHVTMQQIINEYGKSGKVAWIYRHYPIIQLHSKAPKEAEAFECAAELGGNQKFWEYADRLFSITPSNDGLDPLRLPQIAEDIGLDETAFTGCLSSGREQARVQSDFQDGATAGVNGTPHSILMLKKAISAKSKSAILAVMEPYRDQQGDLPTTFSMDGLRMSMNGALPVQTIKATIEALLK